MEYFAILVVIVIIYFIYKANKTPEETKPTQPIRNTTPTITQSYYIVGVMFEGQTSGCYYYLAEKNKYNIGDNVIVPTLNGEKEATVVFTKVYTSKESLPYEYNKLKHVLRFAPKKVEPQTAINHTNGIHIVGVMFDSQISGCYYYLGDNSKYEIGDRVVVPTSNEEKSATVVFKKIYGEHESLPYEKDKLKNVLRKM